MWDFQKYIVRNKCVNLIIMIIYQLRMEIIVNEINFILFSLWEIFLNLFLYRYIF